MITAESFSAVRYAAQAGFPNGRKAGLMLMGAYFDDSARGEHGQHVMAHVGFISSQERWEGFEREWKSEVLDRYNLPYFRMVDCEARPPRGPLKHLTIDRCVEARNTAMPIIGKWINDGMGCALMIEDFKTLIQGSSKKRHAYIRNQFAFCFFATMEQLIRRSNETLADDDKIAVYFDCGSIGKVGRNWKLFKKTLDPRNRVVNLDFSDDRSLSPLQAADAIAYLATKLFFYRQHLELDPDGTVRRECDRLIEMTGYPEKLKIEWYDHENLVSFIDEIKQSGQF